MISPQSNSARTVRSPAEIQNEYLPTQTLSITVALASWTGRYMIYGP